MVLEMFGGPTFYAVSELIQRDLLGKKSIFWISHLHPLREQTILKYL